MAKPVEDRAPKMTPSMPRVMAPMVRRIMTPPMRYTYPVSPRLMPLSMSRAIYLGISTSKMTSPIMHTMVRMAGYLYLPTKAKSRLMVYFISSPSAYPLP